MDDTAKVLVILLLVVFLLFFVIAGPIFTIWSLNLLFEAGIPLCFKTWIAMVWLHMVIAGSSIRAKNSN